MADTTAPLAPVLGVVATSDSGLLATDNISNVVAPQLLVQLQGTGATAPVAGDVLTLYAAGVQVAQATLTSADIAAGQLTITAPSLGADGLKLLTATVTDAAGNTSAVSATLSYVLDTAAGDLHAGAEQ